jgi:hypothetical protein
MDNRAQVREFLASRRARITPGQAGLPAYGGNRRVKGLRREEVALLAGVSIDYYIRMERGDLAQESCPWPIPCGSHDTQVSPREACKKRRAPAPG